MTSCRPSAFGLLLLLVLPLTTPARAQVSADRRADELLARGQKAFAEGNYPEAIDKLRAGFVMSPQPRFLYALGQAYRLNHQCKEAVKAYREFIKAEPSRGQIAAAEANIQRCADEDPSSVEPPRPEPVPEVAPPPPPAPVVAAPPPPPPAPRKPAYKKWWPWTILSVALVGAGLGVGLGLGLRGSERFDATLPEVGPNATR